MPEAAGAAWAPTPRGLAGIAYVGVFASVVAFLCWNRGVAGLGASRAGLFLHLIPVFSAVLAVGLLGESLRAFHGFGAAFIVAGIWLTTARPRA